MSTRPEIGGAGRNSAVKKLSVFEDFVFPVGRKNFYPVNDSGIKIVSKTRVPVVRVNDQNALRPDLLSILEFFFCLKYLVFPLSR